MSAISCPPLLQQDRPQLLALLENCQQQARARGRQQIASFTFPLGTVDPLAALQAVATPQSHYFYWERPSDREAEVAFGTALALELPAGSSDRFARVRQFIAAAMASWHGDTAVARRARFYQCFSFFETSSHFPSAWVVLPRWQLFRRQGRSWLTVNLPVGPGDDPVPLWESVATCLDTISSSKLALEPGAMPPMLPGVGPSQAYTAAVAAALQAIERKSLQKIVLAHNCEVRAPQPFDPIRTLAYLRQHHPHCRIFATSTGRAQTFVGASPERLVSLQDGRVTCDALAGSVRRGRTAAEDALLAGQLLASGKERREHQAVKGFLCDRLQQLGLQPRAAKTRLLRLPNIQHLWTPIRAEMPPALHLLDLVACLHPTPAVAGLPAAAARKGIRHWEPFDRGPYAAPLGWLDCQGNGEFIVSIRSAMLLGARAQLYAGAGIVAGSVPEQERAEVELKLQAMLAALG